MNNQITIDRDFQQLIAPLSAHEFDLLKSQILAQGCLEPLYVWKTEDGGTAVRVLLDGHNRYKICTDNQRPYTTVNIKVDSREQAKLWILEHQAGRRNLTDDQRAVVWNEIREQRSTIAKIERAVKASAVSHGLEVKPDPKPVPKERTRAAVAKEAKLPENKLKQAQILKKHQPELYKKVLAGEITLRNTSKLKSKPSPTRYAEKDFYNRIGRRLHNLYKYDRLDERLDELVHIKKSDWCPAAKEGLTRLLQNFEDIGKETDNFIKTLKAILKENR